MPPHPAEPPPRASANAGRSNGLLTAALLAAVVPVLLAFHQPPSATLLNQCLAVALWGGLVVAIAPRRLAPAALPLLGALALVAAAAVASWAWGTLPRSLAAQASGSLAAAALMVVTGADAARGPRRIEVFVALAWGLLAAGVLSSAVALVQVFAPGWTDGDWIAHARLAGRAVGNLRQPNHLCSLLLWALVALVALHELRRLPRAALWPLAVLLVFAVELSASRTGAVGLALLLLWGLADRRLSPSARWLLVATPLLYALAFGAMAWWGELSHQALGAGARMAALGGLGGADSPNARSNIWRNALALIAANPWTGVGFGEFNFAWSLTAFADRPTAFFDHTHNLPLQLLVELGLPLSLGVMGLLVVALWQAGRRAWRARGETATVASASWMLVLTIGLHSLVEYPLWYTYFLLPSALVWGLALGLPSTTGMAAAGAPDQVMPPPARRFAGLAAGLLMAVGGVLAVLDYQRVVVIYAPPEGSGPLAGRIAQGQLSPLFAHHADYAAATNDTPPASAALGLTRATHSLLDTRLMIAWARHLAATGYADEARWVAQRLRDFRNPEAVDFFAPCSGDAATAFQCQPPRMVHGWRDLAALPPVLAPPGDQAPPASSARQ